MRASGAAHPCKSIRQPFLITPVKHPGMRLWHMGSGFVACCAAPGWISCLLLIAPSLPYMEPSGLLRSTRLDWSPAANCPSHPRGPVASCAAYKGLTACGGRPIMVPLPPQPRPRPRPLWKTCRRAAPPRAPHLHRGGAAAERRRELLAPRARAARPRARRDEQRPDETGHDAPPALVHHPESQQLGAVQVAGHGLRGRAFATRGRRLVRSAEASSRCAARKACTARMAGRTPRLSCVRPHA
eukprot:352223-Chlamydomonas_euryale.AAC.21